MNVMKLPFFCFGLLCLSLGLMGVFWLGKYMGVSDILIQATQIILVGIGLWGTLRFLNRTIWPRYEDRFGKPIPHLIIDMTNFFMLAVAIFVITVFILKQSPMSFLAAGGLITAALAISLQGLIQDIFAALVLDVDVPFKISDWLKLSNGMQGEVVAIAWRHTALKTVDDTIVYIPNGQLIRDQFTNLSQPNKWYWDTLQVTIDHEVPADRVKRILESAVSKLTSIHDHTCLVFAVQPTERGIIYDICYCVPTHGQWPQARHDVIQAVSSALHGYGLKISQTLGEYGLSRGNKDIISTPNIPNDHIIRFNNLFLAADDEIIQYILPMGQRILVDAGEVILEKGERIKSLYLIGEGAISIIQKKNNRRVEKILTFPEFFGEEILYSQEVNSFFVKAKTKAILWEIPYEAMQSLLHRHPHLIEEMARIIAHHKGESQSLFNHWQDKKSSYAEIRHDLAAQIRELLVSSQ